MSKVKLYSPRQAYVGSFLGGPLAAMYVLKKNFDVLGNKSGSRKTLIWGGLLIAIYFVTTGVFLVEAPSFNFPNYVLPIAYSLLTLGIVEKYQMSKKAILASPQYEIESNWRVLFVSVGSLIVFCLVGGLFLFGVLRLSAGKEKAPREFTFAPDSNNGKEMIVEGWTKEELSRILASFESSYKDNLPEEFAPEVGPDIDGVIHVRFPQDIPGPQFLYLINYVQYPKDFDLKSRSILVAGETVLSSDFGPPEQGLVGQEATIYVPSGDQDYDVVYVQSGTETFEVSFASGSWKRVEDPCLPPSLSKLL